MLCALLTLANQELMDINTIVAMASENPSRIYGVRGKGFLQPGFDADLVLVDPKKSDVFTRRMVQSKCGWSPYEGETFTGWPIHVWLRGSQVVRDQELTASQTGQPVRFEWK